MFIFPVISFQEFGKNDLDGDEGSVSDSGQDDEGTSAQEVACQFVPSVLRDTPSGVESSCSLPSQTRCYGTPPQDDPSYALDGASNFRSENGTTSGLRQHRDSTLYQDYSQPQVSCGNST